MPYRPDRRLISVEEARAVLAVHGEPISRIERVALEDADHRVVARDLIAMHDVPPFARSMMDGYAVRAADTAGASRERPVRLRLAGAVFSGHAAESAVVPGTCTLIATGAPLPAGADAIAIVEHTAREDDEVLVFQAAGPRQHIARAGGDLVAGEIALADGTALSPARLGVAAALGLTELDVYASPRVAILSTGDEIVEPGGRSDRRRSSTRTRRRSPRPCACTAATPSSPPVSATIRRRSARHSSVASTPTWCSSRVARRSASGTTCSTSSRRLAPSTSRGFS